MDDQPEASREVVEICPQPPLSHRTNISGYMPTRKSEKVSVSVLIKVLGEEGNEDVNIALITHIQDAVDSVVVGSHGLHKTVSAEQYESYQSWEQFYSVARP